MPRVFALLVLGCLAFVFPAAAAAQTSPTGGAQFADPAPIVAPGSKATLLPDGTAAAPAGKATPRTTKTSSANTRGIDESTSFVGLRG